MVVDDVEGIRDTAHAWHPDVEQHKVDVGPLEDAQPLLAGRGDADVIVPLEDG